MNFLHVTPTSSPQSTDESSYSQKVNFLQIQNINLREYKKKWRLLFNSPPSKKILESIYQEVQQQKIQKDEWEFKEQLLLQCILIHLQVPLNLKLTQEQWNMVEELMPTSRTILEIQQFTQNFLHQSAYNNPWTQQEDNLLLEIILAFKKIKKGNKWSRIAEELNDKSCSKFIRTPKQCRERWGNKIDPQINRDDWTEAEDLCFLQLLLQHGRRWAELSLRLSVVTENKKRTEFALKHRFKKYLLSANNNQQRFPIPNRIKISQDWNLQEINRLTTKLYQLEKKNKSSYSQNFYTYNQLPITKQLKLNDVSKIVIIKGDVKEEIDISLLFGEMISCFNQPQENYV